MGDSAVCLSKADQDWRSVIISLYLGTRELFLEFVPSVKPCSVRGSRSFWSLLVLDILICLTQIKIV